jgi:hypothetical protein
MTIMTWMSFFYKTSKDACFSFAGKLIFMTIKSNTGTELKYAGLSAAALVAWVMMEHALGFTTTDMETGEYTEPIIAIGVWVLLFFGIREKRNKALNGTMTFKQGLRAAFLISFFYAILQALWFAIYTNLIHPDYAMLSLEFKTGQLVAEGKTAEQINEELALTKLVFNSGWLQFGLFIISTTVINTLIGGIMSLFLKRSASQ